MNGTGTRTHLGLLIKNSLTLVFTKYSEGPSYKLMTDETLEGLSMIVGRCNVDDKVGTRVSLSLFVISGGRLSVTFTSLSFFI